MDRECLGLGALRRKPGKGAASGLAGILKLCHKSVLDTRILDETIFDLTGKLLDLKCVWLILSNTSCITYLKKESPSPYGV